VHAVARIATGLVFSDATVVFAFDDFIAFGVLQSVIHVTWLERFSSTMRTDTRYTPSACFDTFPFPDCFFTSRQSSSLLARVGEHGRVCYEQRHAVLMASGQGLTKTYNRFHDAEETAVEIQKLRDIHVEMDKAVAAAYGWDDLDQGHGFHETKQGFRFTISEAARREVLQRLLTLNHERYAEEVKQGLHDKKKVAAKKTKAVKAPAKPKASKNLSLGFDMEGDDE
jgi:hypothetical protein